MRARRCAPRSKAGSGTWTRAYLDWTQARDLAREELRNLLLAAFVQSLLAAQHIDPRIELNLG